MQRNSGTIPWPLSRLSPRGCIIQNCPAIWQMFNACRGPWPGLTLPRHSMLIPHPRGTNGQSCFLPTVRESRNDAVAMILGKFDSSLRRSWTLPQPPSILVRSLVDLYSPFSESRRDSNSWPLLANFNRTINPPMKTWRMFFGTS